MSDLLYSEIEEELRSSVRDLLTDHCPPSAVLAGCESREPYDLALWRSLAAELGAAGLQVPEEYGGAGASLRETAVVMEELGRSVAPVPFLGSAVLATTALLACPASDLLPALAEGARTAVLAVPLSTAPGAAFPSGVRADGNGALTGRLTSVADALTADVLLVPAVDADGPGLYAVEASATGLGVVRRTSLDLTRPLADVTLEGVPARKLAGADTAPAALERALLTGAGLLASEQLGIAEWCLGTTVAYLKERKQFGRALGSFQAIKHRLADLWLETVGARAAARYAADALAGESPDAALAVAVAQAHCGALAVRAAEECVQLHGGIGMTWEHPAHLYLKRAKADQIALGTPGHHRNALAGLVDLPGPVD
ncbi:acyl-CoA dehydrogenase family protein [Kitasatospora atroaurantiaca]|uniref:Alkylation response protein AidB-like acyl-CoA dehydrogenase n=1 Tax=Kitasatospora atroaurantiaca TaxID=285545 RepID=A0A561EL67_9ACTN|nr:acyl-CoA dehydrogenase family protein [Kitasatospora atroaurantiaca]TWE16312.1 alkylation response protein AidB-like acyl-CoA dehydrogenase [Kitasatospora atroaurantiaca]